MASNYLVELNVACNGGTQENHKIPTFKHKLSLEWGPQTQEDNCLTT